MGRLQYFLLALPARGAYLAAIRKEFERRKFDYSLIGGESSMSLANKIRKPENSISVKAIDLNQKLLAGIFIIWALPI